MGRRYDDPEVQRSKGLVPYEVIKDPKSDGVVVKLGNGKTFSPPEISAMILQKLKGDAEAYLGEKVTEAVITVPAYFDDTQRQATKDAGRIAGLDVKRIVNEPTASALAYGLDKTEGREDRRLRPRRRHVRHLASSSCPRASSRSARRTATRTSAATTSTSGSSTGCRDEFKKTEGIDLAKDRIALQRLKEAAEKAKIELSSTTSTEINLPFISADASGPKHLVLSLTRAKLEDLVADLITQDRRPGQEGARRCGHEAGRHRRGDPGRRHDPHAGGRSRRSRRCSTARSRTRASTPTRWWRSARRSRPACSAARSRTSCSSTSPRCRLGIETMGGVATKMINRNTTIPTSHTQIFSTASDNQPSVDIVVLQGEREMAADNKKLATFRLDGIPPAPRGVPQIEVTFDIDANGILNVAAKDKATNKEQKVAITASSMLAKEDVDQMVRDAAEHAEEDRARRAETESRNEADALVYQGERLLKDLDDKLSDEEKAEVNARIEAVREALKGEDAGVVDSTKGQLAEVLQRIGTKAYEATGSAGDGNGTDGAAGDRRRRGCRRGACRGRGRDGRGRVQGGLTRVGRFREPGTVWRRPRRSACRSRAIALTFG